MRNRHPTEKKGSKPTYTHSYISLGTKDKKLLIHLLSNQNSRFNLRNYSIKTGIPRSSVYDILNRLKRSGFVTREIANNTITGKGSIYLESTRKGGVERLRRECRTSANLSTHYHKFKLPISDKTKFKIGKLKDLNPLELKENKLHNLHQIIATFDDATIIINPRVIIINLFDIITEDVSDSDLQSVDRMLEYVKRLYDIGIETEGAILEEGHWARIESNLSDFLFNKVDNKYFLQIDDKRKFWIDHSNKREDETNDKEVRERVDSFLTDVINSESFISDIDKVVKALGFISKIEAIRMKKQIDLNKVDQDLNKDPPDYFG